MKIGIVIPTYQTPKTLFYLERAIGSVNKQSHTDYKVFLIGDLYKR